MSQNGVYYSKWAVDIDLIFKNTFRYPENLGWYLAQKIFYNYMFGNFVRLHTFKRYNV